MSLTTASVWCAVSHLCKKYMYIIMVLELLLLRDLFVTLRLLFSCDLRFVPLFILFHLYRMRRLFHVDLLDLVLISKIGMCVEYTSDHCLLTVEYFLLGLNRCFEQPHDLVYHFTRT